MVILGDVSQNLAIKSHSPNVRIHAWYQSKESSQAYKILCQILTTSAKNRLLKYEGIFKFFFQLETLFNESEFIDYSWKTVMLFHSTRIWWRETAFSVRMKFFQIFAITADIYDSNLMEIIECPRKMCIFPQNAYVPKKCNCHINIGFLWSRTQR